MNVRFLDELVREALGPIDAPFISSDMSVVQVAKFQLRNSFLKKSKDLERADAADLAVEKFLLYNSKCAAFSIEPTRLYDDELIGEVTRTLDRWLHPRGLPFVFADIIKCTALGGGSSIDADMADFYTKLFDSSLSVYNKRTRRYYRSAIAGNPTWVAAEQARHAVHGNAVVSASKMTTVRKQYDIRRTICSEAVAEMFFQLGLGKVLEFILERCTGINLSTQPDMNRELARQGSIDGDSCTIDLRSASDCLALAGLIKRVFPAYVVNWLERFRATHVTLPGGRQEELHMVSTMGNGFTFPLQTMLFASIVVSCHRMLGIPHRFKTVWSRKRQSFEPANVGVFGDDIIVGRKAYHYVVHALELFGFEVNDDKSFSVGHFRESCGHDYYRGVNVRGVYVKWLRDDSDCYSVINRLVRWSAAHGVDLSLPVQYLLGSLQKKILLIPYQDGDTEGFKVPFCVARPDFYCYMTRSPFYRAYAVMTRSWSFPKDDSLEFVERTRKSVPGFNYSSDGAVVSMVGGFLRDGRMAIRSDPDAPIRSKVQQRLVPNWDYIPMADSLSRGGAWQSTAADVAEILLNQT